MAYTLTPIPMIEISRQLEIGWGIQAQRCTELYLGTSGDTGTFQADAADERYFLRLAKTVSETGIAISLLLADRGIPAIAPILSLAGNAWEIVTGYRMVVYPLIDGSPIVPELLTVPDWHSIGAALRAVHDAPVPSAMKETLSSNGEMFVPWGEEFLSSIGPALSNLGPRADSFQEELARVWSQQGTFPNEFFSLVQLQGQAARATYPVCCLCHNDFQSQNILRSAAGVIHLIDWEGATWAPPEKDLMFIAPEHRSKFEMGYGPLHLNEPVMSYYTSNWLLQDPFDCVDRTLFKADLRTEEKQWAHDLTLSILQRMKAILPAGDA